MQVADPAELERAVGELLADEPRGWKLGGNAQKVVRQNLGAIERTVEMILDHLKAKDVYIVEPS